MEVKRPSEKQLLAWWGAQPRGDRKCTDCGKVGDSAYVQPQHPFYADGQEGVSRCGDCIWKRQAAANERRKAQLAAMERCINHPGSRATFTVPGGIGVCGRCLKKARAAHYKATAGFGILGGTYQVTGEDIRRWTGGSK